MTKLSIIIPLYNGKKYLNKLLSSLSKIRISDFEVLIIDDGSKDDSYIYSKNMEEKYSFLKVYTKVNGGIADTRNFGMEKAKGVYVCFVDQDDDIEPTVYEKALKKSLEEDADCCIWSTKKFYENGTKVDNDSFRFEKVYERELIRQALYEQYMRVKREERVFWIPGFVWSGMYKRDFLKKNRISFFAFVDSEDDCVFMNQVLRYGEKIVFIPEVGYYWFCNPKSESHRIKYIPNYWDKSEQLEQWYNNAIYDIFSKESPPKDVLKREKQDRIFQYIENVFSQENPMALSKIIKELKAFFENKEYADLLQGSYGVENIGKSRCIERRLIKNGSYRVCCWFLRWRKRVQCFLIKMNHVD